MSARVARLSACTASPAGPSCCATDAAPFIRNVNDAAVTASGGSNLSHHLRAMPVDVTAVVDQSADRHQVLTSGRHQGLAVADEEESDARSWEGGDADGAEGPGVVAG